MFVTICMNMYELCGNGMLIFKVDLTYNSLGYTLK